MLQAAFFDLDGTLVNTEVLWVKATYTALSGRYGIPMTRDEVHLLVYGRAWGDIYKHLLNSYPNLCGPSREMELALELEFRKLAAVEDTAIPGSVECLKTAAALLPTVAIVSGSPRNMIADAIGKMQVAEHLKFYLGSEDYSPGKPSPTCYLMAAEKAGADPKHCVVFEDSAAGVRSAKAAGMYCVGLKRDGNTQDLSLADEIVGQLDHVDFRRWLARHPGL